MHSECSETRTSHNLKLMLIISKRKKTVSSKINNRMYISIVSRFHNTLAAVSCLFEFPQCHVQFAVRMTLTHSATVFYFVWTEHAG